MHISLLLHNVSQDQTIPQGGEAFYGWMHGPASGGDGDDNVVGTSARKAKEPTRLPKYSLRKETWGGVLVFGPTQAVYQLDHEAYALFERLKGGETVSQIGASHHSGTPHATEHFIKRVAELGLD